MVTLFLENWIFEFLWNYFSSESNTFFDLLPMQSVVFIENALCSKCYSRPTPTFAGHLFFTRYEWQQPAPDHLDGSEDFFSELFFCFLDNGLRSQQGTMQLFRNRITFEGFTINFKSNKRLLWSKCLELDKRKRPWVWKSCSDTSNKGFT